MKTPMQYLDKATATLRDLGLMPTKVEDAPINALLQKISDLDEDRDRGHRAHARPDECVQ